MNGRPVSTFGAPSRGRRTWQAHRVTQLAQIVFELPLVWYDRWLEREQLAGLDEHALKDVGLTRADVDPEIRKPFWRA